eukprot:4452583-Amphidinium_carterae.3
MLEVACFGLNDEGQLGYGDTVSRGQSQIGMGDRLLPVAVGGGVASVEDCLLACEPSDVPHFPTSGAMCIWQELTSIF